MSSIAPPPTAPRLTAQQAELLEHLVDLGPTRLYTLAVLAGTDITSTRRRVYRLEDRGFLTWTQDLFCRVELTDVGREVITEARG